MDFVRLRSRPHCRALLTLVATAAVAACAPGPPEPPVPPGAGGVVFFTGAGDIAICGSTADDSTAALLDRIPGLIWTTGDNAYPSGSARDFEQCYHPSWGRHRERTRPTPGNHEYWTPAASAYFDYFGENAGERGEGWYSYRYGHWLVVALNSNLDVGARSDQVRWLRQVLEENPSRCTVAYFHHPLVSSGAHGDHDDEEDRVNVRPVWQVLYDAGAEMVLAGHDHHYERFAPMTPRALPDPDYGLRLFIVGTGGGVLRGRGQGRGQAVHPMSEQFIAGYHGLLQLELGFEGYRWAFVDVRGRVLDSGEDRCH